MNVFTKKLLSRIYNTRLIRKGRILILIFEKLDGPALSALGVLSGKLSDVDRSWVTKNLIFRAPSCFGRHVKPLVPAVYAVVSPTNPHWVPVVGYDPFSLWVIHKEALCPSSRDINRLMMMMKPYV
jgi:hypothetical protein